MHTLISFKLVLSQLSNEIYASVKDEDLTSFKIGVQSEDTSINIYEAWLKSYVEIQKMFSQSFLLIVSLGSRFRVYDR